MHSEISGTVDFKEPDDHHCIARLRSLVGKIGERQSATPKQEVYNRAEFDAVRDASKYSTDDLYSFLNPAPGASNVYDMREVIARIVDRSEFDEYKADFGRTVLCGYARIGGRAIGIVANQKTNQNQTVAIGPQAGAKRIEVGGVIYTEGAQKAARFIMDCNQNLVPLVFLHDVNGFMVGKDAEWSGIIRAGAKMVSAVSTSVVPKITVIIGGSFGAGHYAMCGNMQATVVSLVFEGVFERFPGLKIVLIEGGFAWVPALTWRMDKHWQRMRGETPQVKRPPSEYVREHFWFTTQPIEEPENPRDLGEIMEWVGFDRLMFSTDYPHWDFDDPQRAFRIQLSEAQRAAVFRDNAKALYAL